jgi:T5SS/PEP-CTERM-associated repeat protein/autotransporter-associated beta strand protein
MKKRISTLILACLFSPSLQAQTTNIWNFNFSGSIVQWTVPSRGYYDVTAYGAQGGGYINAQTTNGTPSVPGGRGAVIGGLFLFEQGEVLNILAGGAGSYSSGGGGSFVVNSSTNPLVVAGGGGGTALNGELWPGASITTSGNDATYVNENEQGSGGTNGTGGTIGSAPSSSLRGGAGGGGFFGNGQSHYGPAPSYAASDMYSAGGTSYLDGGAGGSGGYYYNHGRVEGWTGPTYASDGGFGGGGQAILGGGGGGGYSGGGGGGADMFFGYSGGGGGSFLAASASNDVMRVGHIGNGQVSISAAAVSLMVGNNSSNQSITISSGTNDYYNIVLGGNVGDANNSVSVTNAGTVVNASNYVLVGQNGSSNTMTVSGGASVADQAFSVVGLNATASGNSLRVTGTGSTWSSGGLVIGDSGSGNSMSVEAGGGVVSAGSGVALGYNVGSSGNSLLVDGSGSTLTSVSDLIVGFGGSGNSVVVSNGGTLTNSHYSYGGVIGLNSGATNNSVLVTGNGSAWNSGGDLLVGWGDSGNTLTISNGGAVTSGQVNYGGVIGFNASSTNNSVLVTGTGSTWSNSGDLTIGDAGEGTLTIANGGSVSANAVIIASQAGSSGTLNFGSLGGSDTAGSLIGPGISFGSGSGTINFNQVDSLIGSGFSGNGSLNQLGSGTTTLSGTNTYSGTTTVNSGTLVVQGQPSLGTSSVTVNGGTLVASGVFTEFPLALNAGNMTLTGAGSSWNTGTNTLSVGNSSQGASVVVAGGASVVSEGLLALGMNAGASNNSVLVTGTGSTWSNSGSLTIGDAGEGTLTIANGGSVSANAVIIASQAGSSGTLNFGSLGGSDTAGNFLPPVISFGSGSGRINFNQTDTVAATGFSGNGSLNQLGSGTTILTGTNTYSGTTTVNRGTLVVYDKSFQGTSSLMLNGGTMILAGSGSSWNTGANTLIVGNNSPGVSLVVSNGASLTSGSGILGQDSGASNNSILVTGAGSTWTNGSYLYVGDRSSGNSVKVSAGGTVSVFALYVGNYGSGNSLEVSDGGHLVTGGDYSGSCIIGSATGSSNNSVLVTGSGSSWNNSSTMNIGRYGSGAVTVANGGSMTAGYLSISTYGGSGALNIGRLGSNDTAGTFSAWSLALGTGGVINFNQSDSTTFSTVISGNGSVNQLGSGTTTLTGNNTYTGPTTVEDGTLLVGGQISLSDVSVLNGAAIGGAGTLGGSLSLAAGAQFVFSLNGALTVNGASVTFGDFGIDDLVGLDSNVANGAYTLITGNAAINFSNVANLGAQNAVGISGGKQAYFSEGSLVVNVIPEPSTYALLGLGAIGIFATLRRRRFL